MDAVTTASATDIVAGLAAHLDLPHWPDPVLTWHSSSTAETHPGKRYHVSAHCRRLRDVTRPTVYAYTVAQVGPRRCGECWEASFECAAAGSARQRVEQFLTDLTAFADALDEGHDTVALAKKVATTVRLGLVRTSPAGADVHDSCAAAVSQLLRRRAETQNTGPDAHAVHCAALVLQGKDAFDTTRPYVRRSPALGPQSNLLGSSDLEKGWQVFCSTLKDGHSLADARTQALDEILPLPAPYKIDQLAGLSVTATTGGQAVTVADLMPVWHQQAEAYVRRVVDQWVTATSEVLRLGEQAGTMRVAIVNDYSGPSGIARVQDFHASRYPAQVERSEVVVDVPAPVAELLRRAHNARLRPCETYPAATLAAATRLIGEGLRPMEAYATAKAMCEPAPAAT